jgi:hypothetical protein
MSSRSGITEAMPSKSDTRPTCYDVEEMIPHFHIGVLASACDMFWYICDAEDASVCWYQVQDAGWNIKWTAKDVFGVSVRESQSGNLDGTGPYKTSEAQ